VLAMWGRKGFQGVSKGCPRSQGGIEKIKEKIALPTVGEKKGNQHARDGSKTLNVGAGHLREPAHIMSPGPQLKPGCQYWSVQEHYEGTPGGDRVAGGLPNQIRFAGGSWVQPAVALKKKKKKKRKKKKKKNKQKTVFAAQNRGGKKPFWEGRGEGRETGRSVSDQRQRGAGSKNTGGTGSRQRSNQHKGRRTGTSSRGKTLKQAADEPKRGGKTT